MIIIVLSRKKIYDIAISYNFYGKIGSNKGLIQ